MIVAFVSLGMTVSLVMLTIRIRGRGSDGPPLEADLVRGVAPIVMTAIILLFFGLTADFLDNSRMYLIGILYAIGVGGIMLYVIEGFYTAIAATVGAVGIILGMGVVILMRWIRSHPLPVTAEDHHEG